jgi:c-di-GMP phosphodiesterase
MRIRPRSPQCIPVAIEPMKTLITRQPIFDAGDQIAGYEILFSHAPGASSDEVIERAANEAVVNALLGVGLDRIADGHPAFINVTRDVLLGGALELLDPAVVVIQLLESVDVDDDVIEACRHYGELGYTVALSSFTHTLDNERLLGVARIAGIDVTQYSADELTMQIALLRMFGVEFLAENVTDAADRQLCLELGFARFKGDHFSRPETLAHNDLAVTHLRTVRVMKQLRDLNSSDHAIEEEFRTDLGLSYKLLRIVNSAAIGGQGIRSISHAIRLLGREALYRWLSLLLLPNEVATDLHRQVLSASLARARFCELLADAGTGHLNSGSAFLAGLLSSLDMYYELSLEETVRPLDLAPEISEALLTRAGPLGAAISLVAAYQIGDWDIVLERCAELKVDEDQLTELYLDSLGWAQERINDLEGEPAIA